MHYTTTRFDPIAARHIASVYAPFIILEPGQQRNQRIAILANLDKQRLIDSMLHVLKELQREVQAYHTRQLAGLRQALQRQIRIQEIQSLPVPQVVAMDQTTLKAMILEIHNLNDQRLSSRFEAFQGLYQRKQQDLKNRIITEMKNMGHRLFRLFSLSPSWAQSSQLQQCHPQTVEPKGFAEEFQNSQSLTSFAEFGKRSAPSGKFDSKID